MRNLIVPACILFLASCASTGNRGPDTPEATASGIVSALEIGDAGSAAQLFSSLSNDEEKDQAYPVLYSAAEQRYETGNERAAVEILRFMSPRYPDAASVKLARLYGLFMVRAERPDVAPEFAQEMANVLDEVRVSSPAPPLWVSLIEAQVAIDQGRVEDARPHFESFRRRWHGVPHRLALYVADLERYLATH